MIIYLPRFFANRDRQRIRRPGPPLIKTQWYQRSRLDRDRLGLIRLSNKNNQPEINTGEDNNSLSEGLAIVPRSYVALFLSFSLSLSNRVSVASVQEAFLMRRKNE